MDKKKKIIFGAVAIIVIIAIIIGILVINGTGKTDGDKKTENVSVTTTVSSDMEEVTFTDEPTEAKENEEETNFWDNVEVIEQTDSNEPKTDKNGETVTEAYPGENDGWSPIVSPDDLEQNK